MEIKYKGKRIDCEEWVYGCPIIHSDGAAAIFVIEEDKTLFVHRDSIRRSIKAVDKNGTELYVGDIVNDFGGGIHVERTEATLIKGETSLRSVWVKEGSDTRLGEIIEEEGTTRVKTNDMSYCYNLSNASKFSDMEKAGDVYNNPELLQEQD